MQVYGIGASAPVGCSAAANVLSTVGGAYAGLFLAGPIGLVAGTIAGVATYVAVQYAVFEYCT